VFGERVSDVGVSPPALDPGSGPGSGSGLHQTKIKVTTNNDIIIGKNMVL
jgi:hypothetical protein